MNQQNSIWGVADAEIDRPDLRDYQTNCIGGLRQSIAKGNKRLILQASTGAGKTIMAAEIIRNAESKGNRTLFVCDSLELVEQAVTAFDSYGLDVGVMQGQHYRTDESRLTQVCTAQTLDRRIKRYRNEFDRYPVAICITDECHVQHSVRDVLASIYPDAIQIGLTATPFAKALGKFYGGVVSAISMRELIDQGYLSKYKAFAPFVPDMKGVTTQQGDYAKDQTANIYDNEIIGDIVTHWKKHASDRPTIAFGCNVAHSKAIAEAFKQAGVEAYHIDGYGGDKEKEERTRLIEAYKAGDIQMLSSVGILTKGFDAPLTSCLIIARPTKSLMLHWQVVGRGLRTAEGKKDCIILDHAGNFVRHGFPDDPIDFELDNGKQKTKKTDKRKDGEKLPVPCPACHTLKTSHKCPSCGFAPEKQNEIVNVDGELVELKKAQADEKKKAKKNYTKEDKQNWYSQLLGYGRDRNYKAGWAANKYRSKFDVWPRGLNDDTLPMSDEVHRFIISENIRYSKGKADAA